VSDKKDSETTVYGKPDCQGCKATIKKFDQLNLPYNYVDITVDEVAHQEVKNLGYTSAPVVVTNSGHWTGYSPDKIRKLK
jgi:glutaredoxin-like protein NrdH